MTYQGTYNPYSYYPITSSTSGIYITRPSWTTTTSGSASSNYGAWNYNPWSDLASKLQERSNKPAPELAEIDAEELGWLLTAEADAAEYEGSN